MNVITMQMHDKDVSVANGQVSTRPCRFMCCQCVNTPELHSHLPCALRP
jgi:hypothetical protein